MTASENPPALTTIDRLEGLYGLTSADLGLDEAAFTRRGALWEQLAAEQGGTPRQQQARVRVTALTNTITALMRRADEFRAEGDITTERDILGRVEVFQGWLKAAAAEADPTSPSSGGPKSAFRVAPGALIWVRTQVTAPAITSRPCAGTTLPRAAVRPRRTSRLNPPLN